MPNILGWKFGIVVSEWNSGIMENLLVGCKDTLIRHGANINDIITYQVPGSFELPVGAKILANKFFTLYMLCRDLLSKAEHYDWGLRAIKSVLVVAGSFKRSEPDISE